MPVTSLASLKGAFLETDPQDWANNLIDSALVQAAPLIPPGGNWYFVDATNGSATGSGSWDEPVLTIAQAYALTTDANHDVVCVKAAVAGTTELAAITWSKNFTHLIGLGAPTHISQRTRISCGANALTPFVTFSGYGNIISNVMFWQGRDHATTLVNVSVTGNRNLFWNVHFAGGGHVTQAVDGGASLLINGGKENLFQRCTIGVDTVDAATGMAGLVFAATGGAARNRFENCYFTMYAGHTGAIFVEVLGTASGQDRYTTFEKCRFINLGLSTMATAFAIPAGYDPASKRFLLFDCELIGATDWDKDDRGLLYLNSGTRVAGGNAGILLVSTAA